MDEEELDTEWTHFPTCPHCGVDDQDWWDGIREEKHDGDEWTVSCHNCSKEYRVTMAMTYSFNTVKINEGEGED